MHLCIQLHPFTVKVPVYQKAVFTYGILVRKAEVMLSLHLKGLHIQNEQKTYAGQMSFRLSHAACFVLFWCFFLCESTKNVVMPFQEVPFVFRYPHVLANPLDRSLSRSFIPGICLTQASCLAAYLVYKFVPHSNSQFTKHSGSKSCKKVVKEIICSGAQYEGIKIRQHLKNNGQWLQISFYRALLTTIHT